jgi:DNA-binding NarL/FixJ family response regulator
MQNAKNTCSSSGYGFGRTAAAQPVCDDQRMGRTVLIVDDHPSFRASARALLEADGFDVVGEAADGASALDAAAELHPELVLLDVQLPDMTGFAVCAALAGSNGSLPDVILVSSRDSSDYGELVAVSRTRGFVPKDELSGEVVAALLG